MDFSEVVPTAEEIIALPPAELGRRMVPFLARWPKGHAFSLAELKARVAGDEPNAFPMGSYAWQHRAAIRQALAEAWEWLRNQGCLVPDEERTGGLMLTRQAFSLPRRGFDEAISEAGRRERFARWEQLGVDRIKNDLLTTGGDREVGGPQSVRDLAWDWVREKEKTARKSISRRTILASTIILKCLGHSEFTNLMLEFGLPDEAGRGEGLKARTTSLATYALQNPETRTTEGQIIAEAILERALQLYQDRGRYLNNVTSDERKTFQEAMIRDGFLKDDDRKQIQEEEELKRDPELVIKLLEKLEDYSDRPGALYVFDHIDSSLTVEGYSSDQILYHLNQLREMGLVDSPGSQPMVGITFRGLSAQGHSFLEQQRAHHAPNSASQNRTDTRKVFIVHGHDDGAREAIARFLERLGFDAIILHEQANQGRTVIEKVETHGDVGFAVILLTPDDEGAKKGEALKPRARQNVILELGYFVGRLGRKHVCALTRGDIEIPSDFGGVVYERFDTSGGWKQALGRELHAAGFEIDWNKVMRP